jgi:hypothetical protein
MSPPYTSSTSIILKILLNQLVDKTMVTAVVKVDVNKNEDIVSPS